MTEDERRKAVLFNDITHAPVDTWLHLGDRTALRDYLWVQGWRRDVRDGDITEGHRPSTDELLGADRGWTGGSSVDDFMDEQRRR